MAKINPIWYIIGGTIILAVMARAAYSTILKTFLPEWEGFKAIPYWDYKQWTWGYGTKVPGSKNNSGINPGGSITREQAMKDAMEHIAKDYNYLSSIVQVPLSAKQWAALLSFSYNLGPGNADNLVQNINRQDWKSLENQWKQYVYAGGVINHNLIDRRNAEWNLFTQNSYL